MTLHFVEHADCFFFNKQLLLDTLVVSVILLMQLLLHDIGLKLWLHIKCGLIFDFFNLISIQFNCFVTIQLEKNNVQDK